MEHQDPAQPVVEALLEQAENAPEPEVDLRRENEELRLRLSEVVETAANNERIWRHFAEVERILFRTRRPDTLAEELVREIRERFQPDEVIFFVSHPDLLERFFPDLSEESGPLGEGMWVLPFPANLSPSLCSDPPKAFMLSAESIQAFLQVLPEEVTEVESAVLIPLCIHKNLFGGLFLGSQDPDRYRPGDGTDLLEQLGSKVALCIDNCLTYEKLRLFSSNDTVTGLLNFFQLGTILEREFSKARRGGSPFSILILDLDFVNQFDEDADIGHDILRHVAAILQETLPRDDCFVGRYGSDEFLLVLPGVSDEEAREVVPYLTQKIRKSPFRYGKTAILIQALIGIASLDEDMERPQDLLDTAYSELCRLKMSRSDGE